MNKTPDKQLMFASLIDKVREIAARPQETNEKLFSVCKLLKDYVPYYNWVGFYLLDQPHELAIGPFVGEPTEHGLIPFGTGLCGQAAERKETIIVQDISQETNYLSCSPKVKSEIIVPIFKTGELVGVLDIDSYARAPFTEEDRVFLETIGEIVSALYQNQ